MDDKRDLYNGFGNTLSRSIELVAAPLIFAFIGHLLDRWLGLTPILTIALAAFAVAGTFLRLYYGYGEAMRHEEANAPWARSRP